MIWYQLYRYKQYITIFSIYQTISNSSS